MKNFLKPRKFIDNLPTKLSWPLLLSLIFLSVLFLLVFILPNSNEFLNYYKQFVITTNGWSANQPIQNIVLVQSLISLIIIKLLEIVLEVAVLFLALWTILRAFKIFSSFWKLVNIYLYAKLVSTLVMTPYFLFIAFNSNYSDGLIEQTFNYLLKQNSSLLQGITGNYYLITLGIISVIIFCYLFIGGLVIYLKGIKKSRLSA